MSERQGRQKHQDPDKETAGVHRLIKMGKVEGSVAAEIFWRRRLGTLDHGQPSLGDFEHFDKVLQGTRLKTNHCRAKVNVKRPAVAEVDPERTDCTDVVGRAHR